MYHSTIPTLMKARKVDSVMRPKEGARQMLKGRMGSFANLDSQIANAAICRRAIIKMTYS